MAHAWIISTEHSAITDSGRNEKGGTMGPRRAPKELQQALLENTTPVGFSRFVFRMYDDDGILYYTGTLITDDPGDEEACYAPLGDYGTPNAGAIEIRYAGHPEMDCG